MGDDLVKATNDVNEEILLQDRKMDLELAKLDSKFKKA